MQMRDFWFALGKANVVIVHVDVGGHSVAMPVDKGTFVLQIRDLNIPMDKEIKARLDDKNMLWIGEQ